jgi:hypothetical protein
MVEFKKLDLEFENIENEQYSRMFYIADPKIFTVVDEIRFRLFLPAILSLWEDKSIHNVWNRVKFTGISINLDYFIARISEIGRDDYAPYTKRSDWSI